MGADELRLVVGDKAVEGDEILLFPSPRRIVMQEGSKLRALPLEAGLEESQEFCIAEPVASVRGLDLFVRWTGTGSRPRVNGFPALSAFTLKRGDEVIFPSFEPLRLAMFRREPVSPLEADEIGKCCYQCGKSLPPHTLAYRCVCREFLCVQESESPEPAVSCASIHEVCPKCGLDVSLNGGYVERRRDIYEKHA
jgi:hypothetical protein